MSSKRYKRPAVDINWGRIWHEVGCPFDLWWQDGDKLRAIKREELQRIVRKNMVVK